MEEQQTEEQVEALEQEFKKEKKRAEIRTDKKSRIESGYKESPGYQNLLEEERRRREGSGYIANLEVFDPREAKKKFN